jgi:ABC-type branched-subunit amino acid transport system permease subunit
VFRDRLYTAAIAIVLALAIAAMTRWTRFGLATTAAAESERGAALTGLNANALATVNWMMATVLAGLAMVIIAPVNQLDPLALSLLVVPALAAAMIGGFRSYLVTAGAGLLLGMCQFELMSLQINWGGLGGISLPQALPFVVILITLVVRGDALPARGERATSRLPASPEPRRIGLWAAVACGCGLTVMAFGSSDWRSAVITSAIATVMSLSVVLLTGYIGQISLAPFAFAGVGAFTLVRLGELGVPFPAAPLLAVLASVVLGLIIGLPATRARGMQLAVATLAAAVAVEALLWKWGWFVGHSGGKVPEPKIGAVDLGIAARGDDYPRAVFGVVVVVIAVAACTGLAIIRTRPTGLKWLAIRSNERAAAALAINVGRSKLLAFAASALLAGLGGVLLAYQRQSVSTDSFQVFASLSVIALTYLGGVASVSGAVLAGLLAPLGVITVLTGQDLTEVSPYAFVINAVLLIGAALLMPEGLAGLAERVRSEVGSSVTQRRVGRESVSTAQ